MGVQAVLRVAGWPRTIGLWALARLTLLGVWPLRSCLRARGMRIELAGTERHLQLGRVVLQADQAWLEAGCESGVDLLGLGAASGKGEYDK